MARQSTVTQFQRAGARGLVANAEARNLISRALAASAFTLMFADPVYRVVTGSGDEQCSADPAAGAFLGLARREGAGEVIGNTPVDSFAQYDEVPIMEAGVMWVETAGAVAAGAAANFNTTTRLWTSAAVAGAIIDIPNAEFDSTLTAAGLAKVRVKRAIA